MHLNLERWLQAFGGRLIGAWMLITLGLSAAISAPSFAADAISPAIAEALRPLANRPLATGVLYDRVLPLSGIERYTGAADSPAITLAVWRQMADELRRASTTPFVPPLAELHAAARRGRASNVVPLAILDARYERLAPGAVAGDRIAPDAPLVTARAFAVAPLVERTYRGAEVRFAIDGALYFTNDAGPRAIAVDFGDGLGERPVVLGDVVPVRYDATGPRTLRMRVTATDGTERVASTVFNVAALVTPTPDDTLHITATVAYQGAFGKGDAYVRLAPGHASIRNPVVLIEGFDLDNSMDWDELYALMNDEGLADDLYAAGYDAVVLNFSDATDYVQRNSYVVTELIRQVGAGLDPGASMAVIGASMGGLCSRYALAWMEVQAIPHHVRTWIALDAPQLGANIPLGIQYWLSFFASQSTDAATLLGELNRPAARQMLLYHYTDPPQAQPQADPLRATMLGDFAAVGDYPTLLRRVGIANGSSTGANQGFAAGDQIIAWNYSSAFVAVTGNVWAVPNQTSKTIFNGSIRIFISTTSQSVTVNNTKPWDGAPGGWRASMAEMDAVQAPYGDIIALYPNHCFIPTVSALALNTTDPFYDVDGDANLVAHSKYDAVDVPTSNQEHVDITPENAAWLRAEIERGVTAVPLETAAGRTIAGYPNPFTRNVHIAFALATPARVDAAVYGLDGRRVRTLRAGELSAGSHELGWDGRDDARHAVPAGIYFVRLAHGSSIETTRIVKVD